MMPFSVAKAPTYAKIALAGLFFYNAGVGYVQSKFGDKAHGSYLTWNKGAIMRGSKPWEKQEAWVGHVISFYIFI